jgi:hypothetical protein
LLPGAGPRRRRPDESGRAANLAFDKGNIAGFQADIGKVGCAHGAQFGDAYLAQICRLAATKASFKTAEERHFEAPFG